MPWSMKEKPDNRKAWKILLGEWKDWEKMFIKLILDKGLEFLKFKKKIIKFKNWQKIQRALC